jgi:archaellum component FlaC
MGKLLIELAADTARFKSDMGKAARAMDTQSKRIEASGKRMDKMFAGLKASVVGFVAAVGVGGIARVFQDVAANAQSLQQVTQNLNVTVEGFQKLQIAADFAGVSSQQLEKGLQRMVRRLSEAASGTGEARAAFQELGIDVQRLERLDAATQFEVITEALLKSGTAADSLRLSFKFFDSEFAQGAINVAKAAKEVGDQFDDMLLTKEQVDSLANLQTTFDNIAVSIKLATAQAVAWIQAQEKFTMNESLPQMVSSFEEIQALLQGESSTEKLDVMNAALERQAGIIKKLKDEIADIQPGDTTLLGESTLVVLEKELKSLEATYDVLLKKRRELEVNAPPSLTIPIRGQLGGAGAGAGATSATSQAVAETQQLEVATEAVADAYANLSFNMDTVPSQIQPITEETQRLDRAANQLGFTFESAFEDAVIEGQGLRQVLEGILADIARIVLRLTVTEPLGRGISGLLSGIGTGASSGGVGSTNNYPGFFQGTYASGGPVSAGKMALVGERGPELFVPGSAGNIVSNGALGGQSANISFTVNAIDAQSFQGALAQHERQITGMVRKGFARRGSRVDL